VHSEQLLNTTGYRQTSSDIAHVCVLSRSTAGVGSLLAEMIPTFAGSDCSDRYVCYGVMRHSLWVILAGGEVDIYQYIKVVSQGDVRWVETTHCAVHLDLLPVSHSMPPPITSHTFYTANKGDSQASTWHWGAPSRCLPQLSRSFPLRPPREVSLALA
jgi:hypothetical protein